MENNFAKLLLVRLRDELNQLSWSFNVLQLRHRLTDCEWAVKDNTHKKHEIEKVWNQLKRGRNLLT